MSNDQFEDKDVKVLDDEKSLLLDHDYDGIKELDNPLPMWWLWTFFGAIIFSFIYFIHYHLDGGGMSLNEQIAQGAQKIDKMRADARANRKTLPEDEFIKLASDSSLVEKGKVVYGTYCASCHGPDGGGLIGPNLTDNFWKMNDVSMGSIASVVRSGIAGTGMPPWEAVLDNEQVQNVTIYIRSIQGSSPTNPKAPEGKEVSL